MSSPVDANLGAGRSERRPPQGFFDDDCNDDDMNLTAFESWLTDDRKYARPTVVDTVLAAKRLLVDQGARGKIQEHYRPFVARIAAYGEDAADEKAVQLAEWATKALPDRKKGARLGGRALQREAAGREARAFDDAAWEKLRKGLRADPAAAARVLEVMAVTSLRVTDVLRIPRVKLVAGVKAGVVDIVVKGGKKRKRPTAGGETEWARLAELFIEHPDADDVAHAVSPDMHTTRGAGATGAYQAVRRALVRHCRAAGITEEVWTHRIRRTVLVHASLISGGDRLAVRDLGDHESERSGAPYQTEARPERVADMQVKLARGR